MMYKKEIGQKLSNEVIAKPLRIKTPEKRVYLEAWDEVVGTLEKVEKTEIDTIIHSNTSKRNNRKRNKPTQRANRKNDCNTQNRQPNTTHKNQNNC